MKRLIPIALITVLALAGRASSNDETKDKEGCQKPEARPVPGWSKLAALAGEWRTKGGETRVTFQLTGGGTALLETHAAKCCGEMVTLYHADLDHLVLTHYCSIGNQPRMKAERVGENEIEFRFLDATNLAKPADPHMHALRIRFVDDKHYTEEWTFLAGAEETKKVFEFERVK
jgi:hypothetical protein